MSLLSVMHVVIALLAATAGVALFALRKGDRRHRVIGWIYVAFMLTSLAAILIRGVREPHPFHGYALITAAGVVAAVVVSRFRRQTPGWRAWHACLMSFSMLAAVVAIGGVIGGLLTGVGTGAVYYRMFNGVIVVFTLAGLAVIGTRPVIWRDRAALDAGVRWKFTAMALVMSTVLVISQWMLFR